MGHINTTHTHTQVSMAVRTVVQHGSDGGVSRQRPLNGPTVAPLPLTPLPKAPVALPLPSQQPVPSHPNPCLSRQEGYDPSMMIRSHCLHPNSIHPPHVPDSCSMGSSGDGEGKEDILGVSQAPGKKQARHQHLLEISKALLLS